MTPEAMTPEERAYDLCNCVSWPGWGDMVTDAIATAIREAEAAAEQRGYLRGLERCGCFGQGVDSGGTTPWGAEITIPCSECEKGWTPIRDPHCRGCWCVDMILNLS